MSNLNFPGGRSSRGPGSGYHAYTFSNLNLTEEDHIRRLEEFSKVCLAVSIFFWCWAVFNTYKMNGSSFDGGVISFFLSGSSSLYLYRNTKRGPVRFSSPGVVGRGLILASHLSVALNYALGAFLAFALGTNIYFKFATYCIIFFLGWLYTAIYGWGLVTNTLDINAIEDEVEVEDLNPSFDF